MDSLIFFSTNRQRARITERTVFFENLFSRCKDLRQTSSSTLDKGIPLKMIKSRSLFRSKSFGVSGVVSSDLADLVMP